MCPLSSKGTQDKKIAGSETKSLREEKGKKGDWQLLFQPLFDSNL